MTITDLAVDPDTVCRSTGEHDKNFRELFIGDMVNDFGGGLWVKDEVNTIEGQAFPPYICVGDRTRIGIIVHEDGTTRIKTTDFSYSYNLSNASKLSNMEFVRNIFDEPMNPTNQQ